MIKRVTLRNDLIINIYTIGIEPCGESILFTINDGDNILFTGIIDYYNKDNIILDLLNSLSINHLNYLCITHPHLDHCKGVEQLIDMIDNQTIITLPEGILKYKNDYDEEIKISLEELENLLVKKKNSLSKPIYYSCSDCKEILSDFYFIDKTNTEYELNISTISPISNILERYSILREREEIRKKLNNDFSLVNIITIGELKLFLGSDIENPSINYWFKYPSKTIRNFFEGSIEYLKIPHHASPSSNRLIEFLEDNESIISNSVSTIYRSSKLPNEKVLSYYATISDKLYSTGKIKSNEVNKNYGIIKFEFNLHNQTKKTALFEDAI